MLASYRDVSMEQVRVGSTIRPGRAPVFNLQASLTPQTIIKYACSKACTNRRKLTCKTSLQAKRVSVEEQAAAGEWAALLSVDSRVEDEEITVERLNEICNRGLKLMLGDRIAELQNFQDELNVLGKTFTDNRNLGGALFVYALYKMSDHVVVKETDNLEGIYLAAFVRVFSILEDSGWKLAREGEEEDEEISLDDIPALGYMQNI